MEKETSLAQEAVRRKRKIKRLLTASGVALEEIKMLEPVIENTVWMELKLERAREEIAEDSVAVPYDNGGGQRGIRENPLFTGYEKLWRSYMAGLNKIMEPIPEDAAERSPKKKKEMPSNGLELGRDQCRKA